MAYIAYCIAIQHSGIQRLLQQKEVPSQECFVEILPRLHFKELVASTSYLDQTFAMSWLDR